jgi:hypothetical protein
MATPTTHPQYDLDAWAEQTELGRRVFNYNYRMTGSELRGWELVNTVDMASESGLTERVYLWEKKGSEGRQVIRIGITEADEWRRAQADLQNRLVFSMRRDIPGGKGGLAKLGDVRYAASSEDSETIASAYFVRGNLSISIASVGEEPADVSAVARSLDRAFTEPPKQKDLEEKRAEDRSPKPRKVKKGERALLKESLPEPVLRNGWLKVIVPDGEIAREGDDLVFRSPTAGTKRIQEFLVIQE